MVLLAGKTAGERAMDNAAEAFARPGLWAY
jgi:hypothetical protein